MLKTVTIGVDGMTCQGCVKSVTRALQAVPGVSGAEVSLEGAEARVTFDESRVQAEALKAAIAEAGFEPRT